MALAIATGLPPQHGLYTAIVAGAVIALLGGSRCQVSGPTAAFVVILGPIVSQFGLAGLMVATMLAGVMMMGLGLFRLGRLIQFVPYPVVTGFTAGIAVVIATGQLHHFLGLQGIERQDHFHEVVAQIGLHLHTLSPWDLGIGLGTLLLLIAVPRWTPRVPAALLAIAAATLAAWLLRRIGLADVVTIAGRFSYTVDGQTVGGVPPWLPDFVLPWHAPGPGGQPLDLSWDKVKALVNAAIAICLLGAIESLLSAVAADGMAGTRHDPDAELLAQGVGNVVAPFFGGFAATGAIARTATNVRAGARSPLAAVVHSGFLLLAVLAMAPVLGAMPMSALAAVLLAVAWRMADARHFVRVLRTAPQSDVLVLLCCFLLTVLFDMVVGVTVGIGLAGMLFMRRMSELSGTRLVRGEHQRLGIPIPEGVLVYEVEGPLFFGAAERAMNTLHSFGGEGRVVVLDLDGVPIIDATGLVNLQSVLAKLAAARVPVVLTGVRPAVREVLARSGIGAAVPLRHLRPDLQRGIALAADLLAAETVPAPAGESAGP